MNEYLEKLDAHLGNIKRTAEEESDPHRSKILWNYLHHGAFEVGGDWERIFEPEFIVDDPHYELREGHEAMVLDGQDEVGEFYKSLEDANLMFIDEGNHQLFVNDDGLAEFASEAEFVSGQTILDEGLDSWYYQDVEIDDPDATYVKKCQHATFWPYTEDERLLGEMIYQITPYEVLQVSPEEVPPLDEVEELVEKYYPENVDGPTPYAADPA